MWRLFLLSLSECASERDVENVAFEISKQWSSMGTVPEMGQPVALVGPFLRGETRMGK